VSLSSERLAAWARLLVEYCLEVRENQQVLVVTTTLAHDLAARVAESVLERSAYPLLRLTPPDFEAMVIRAARGPVVERAAPLELEEAGAGCSVRIRAPGNLRELAGVPQERVAAWTRRQSEYRRRLLSGRWTLTQYPTPALAQEASMSTAEYEELCASAMFLDEPDPVARWRELGERQARMIAALEGRDRIRIQTPLGTDLTFSIAGRTFVNSDGKRNLPSGEIFTSPVEESAEGVAVFDLASGRDGQDVGAVRLVLRGGEVVEAEAERGQDHLAAMLAVDDAARRLGEWGIGTNAGLTRATHSILYDEKIAGTVHLALGNAYPETGGRNTSGLHWDLVMDLRAGGAVSADGQVICRDGVWSV
jgi:aminopeptidase